MPLLSSWFVLTKGSLVATWVAALIFCCWTFDPVAAEEKKETNQLECAAVTKIICEEVLSKETSNGFVIENKCDKKISFRYDSHHKHNNHTYSILDTVGAGETMRRCGVTTDADQEFVAFVLWRIPQKRF